MPNAIRQKASGGPNESDNKQVEKIKTKKKKNRIHGPCG